MIVNFVNQELACNIIETVVCQTFMVYKIHHKSKKNISTISLLNVIITKKWEA